MIVERSRVMDQSSLTCGTECPAQKQVKEAEVKIVKATDMDFTVTAQRGDRDEGANHSSRAISTRHANPR